MLDKIRKVAVFRKGASWVVDVSQLQDTWRRPYITDAPFLLVVCHEVGILNKRSEYSDSDISRSEQ